MASFRMNITGIVAFVPDEEQNRLGVVVVDTSRSSDSGGLLYDDLVSHMPVLKYRARDHEGASSPELLGLQWQELDIKGRRLYFEFDGKADELELDLFGVPPIEATVGPARMDLRVLSGSSPFVHAQLALGDGRLYSSPDTVKKWAFKREWTDEGDELELSGKTVWEVDDVKHVTVVLDTMDGSRSAERVALVARADSDIELELSNVCPRPPERPSDWRKMGDVDFRWHFELLDSDTKYAIREQLKRNDGVPIPFPLENPLEAPRETVETRRPLATDTMCLQAKFTPARLGWPRREL